MPQNLQNNPAFQLVLVLLLAGAIVYAGINYMPNTAQMQLDNAGLKDQITKLQDVVNEGLKLEKRLPELRQTIREKEKQLDTLKKIIPTQREAEDLIRKLELMAAQTTISVRSFAPKGQIARQFYYEWPISITALGSYHNLGRFFSRISNYARIINVEDVRIMSAKGKNLPPTQTINTAFTAVTYVYREDGGEEAAPGKKGKKKKGGGGGGGGEEKLE